MMKWNQLLGNIKSVLIKIIQITIFIGVAILIIFYFRWVGFRGFTAFVAGLFLMGTLLLSKNSYLKFVIDLTNSDQYLWEIMNGDKKDEKSRKENN